MKRVILAFMLCFGGIHTQASTLQNVISHVLDTNPMILERLHNYKAKQAEIGIAEAGYYPTVDIESAAGRKTTGRISGDILHNTYNIFQNSLVLRQNIFNGFATDAQVNYQKMSTLSAAYSYLNKANDLSLQAIKVYLNLEKEKTLLENAKLNVKHNQNTYKKVKSRYDSGLALASEVSKIHASLSLSKSNLRVQKNKLMNAHNDFKRVVGTSIDTHSLKHTTRNIKLPESKKKAISYALQYNPSLLAGKYNIKGAKALYNESKSSFYPKVNLELSQQYNKNHNEFLGTDDRAQGMVVLSYNLYNGGADEAKKLNAMSRLNQEVSLTDDLKREVLDRLYFAWNSHKLAKEQMQFLNTYKKESHTILNLYTEEYLLGKRPMLDIISAENDYKNAKDELVATQYNILLSKYEILHSMGLTIASILGEEKTYFKRVNIKKQSYSPTIVAPQKEELLNKEPLSTKPLTSPTITKGIQKRESSIFDVFTKVRWESR